MVDEFDIDRLRKSIQLGVNEVVHQLEAKREKVTLNEIDADSFLTTLDKAVTILKKLEAKKTVTKEKDGKKTEVSYVMKKYMP